MLIESTPKRVLLFLHHTCNFKYTLLTDISILNRSYQITTRGRVEGRGHCVYAESFRTALRIGVLKRALRLCIGERNERRPLEVSARKGGGRGPLERKVELQVILPYGNSASNMRLFPELMRFAGQKCSQFPLKSKYRAARAIVYTEKTRIRSTGIFHGTGEECAHFFKTTYIHTLARSLVPRLSRNVPFYIAGFARPRAGRVGLSRLGYGGMEVRTERRYYVAAWTYDGCAIRTHSRASSAEIPLRRKEGRINRTAVLRSSQYHYRGYGILRFY